MKNLNITKEQFNKSTYFQKKYGTLKYVSESGKIFKTNKGNLIRLNEAKSKYDGIENTLETLKKKLEEDTSDMERVAMLKERVGHFTLEALKKMESIKHAKSEIASQEKDMKYLEDDAKEFAKYLQIEDGNALFFAVQEHAESTAEKIGYLIDSKVKVTSQGAEYEKLMDKLNDPDIIAHCPNLKDAAANIIGLLKGCRTQLIEAGLFEPSKPEKTLSANLYDQHDDVDKKGNVIKGKMSKISEGRFTDMVKGAWRKVKSGISGFCDWFTGIFKKDYERAEEDYNQKLREYDAFLYNIDDALAGI